MSSLSPLVERQAARPHSAPNGVARQHQACITHQPFQQGGKLRSTRPQTMRPRDNRSFTSGQRSADAHTQRANGFNSSKYQKQGTHPNEVEWRAWQELSIKMFELPQHINTKELRECFEKEGTVISVEIFENSRNERHGGGRIRFSPPPARSFWESRWYRLEITGKGSFNIRTYLEPRKSSFVHISPVNPQRRYPERMELYAETLDFGIMLQPSTMMSKKSIQSTHKTPVKLIQNMRFQELTVEFQLVKPNGQSTSDPDPMTTGRTDLFRFRVPFQQMQTIYLVPGPQDQLVLLVPLDIPPKFFRKLSGIHTDDPTAKSWFESDTWYRQTDVACVPSILRSSAVALEKSKPVLDLGRWTTYRLIFNMSKADELLFRHMKRALKDYNVDVIPFQQLMVVPSEEPTIWKYIGKLAHQKQTPSLSFEVRYQLEVCMSHGMLNEHNLTRSFLAKLSAMGQDDARNLLEYIAGQKERVYDPMSIFDLQVSAPSSKFSMPEYCALTRSVTVTPTTLYFNTPTVETSNRIIRQYPAYADRFIRVRFTDEKLEGKVYSTHKETMNEVFTRVKRTMTEGITIGDRHYRFLASGNSQFREQGAYFFAPPPELSVAQIRQWMGSFQEIHSVALFNSRLGQCFSTTRAIATQLEIIEIKDIKRNGFKFSDGVGRMSLELARVTASGVGLMHQEPPSAFQFRLGGCKGVLAVWPQLPGRQLHIRLTQYKFPASHEGLEIIRWSQFACSNLNRQLILVLSALGVQDSVFVQKLKEQLSNIDEAMTNPAKALAILQKDIDHNQMTLALAGMILDGFQTRYEPFITSLLRLWRAWAIKYLKEKARITISRGALLLGCLDETATLRGHYNDAPKIADSAPIDEKVKHVPEVFVQLSKGAEGNPRIILGPMILARNPSLHPGDIRVVCGVDAPQLRHLKDCVVLPQTGDRDVASMCSGGDLDGDDFTVIWDPDLLPKEWNHEPMDYSAPPKIVHEGKITDDHLTTFFVTYMKNDTLPTIAHAHVANADWFEDGVKTEKCLKLAALHSMAVDFVKTGQPAQMTRELHPRKWPHFMEKKRLADQIYISGKVLGKLYDQVERVAFTPAFTAPFDQRILDAFDVQKDTLEVASNLKQNYDAHVHRIMAQHSIKTEFEVWSTFVMEHNSSNDFKFHEKIGSISTALKDQFRDLCRQKAGGRQYAQLAPFVAAMYKVTSEEMAAAVKERTRSSCEMTPDTMPLMSFPWLFQDMLGQIANLNDIGPKNADSGVGQKSGTSIVRDSAPLMNINKARPNQGNLKVFDDIKTADGITHRGDLLELQFGEPDGASDREHKPKKNDVMITKEESSPNAPLQPSSSGSADGSSFADLAFDNATSDLPEHAIAMSGFGSEGSSLHSDLLIFDSDDGTSHSSLYGGIESCRSLNEYDLPSTAGSAFTGTQNQWSVIKDKQKASALDLNLSENASPKNSETCLLDKVTTKEHEMKMVAKEEERDNHGIEENEIKVYNIDEADGKDEHGEGGEAAEGVETVQLHERTSTMHERLADFDDETA